MSDDKIRKDVLVTVRMNHEDLGVLNEASTRAGKSRSDMIARACKFFISSGMGEGAHEVDKDDRGLGKERKNHKVHVRMTRTDAENLGELAANRGTSVSKIVREAFKEYAKYV